ncbi:MAG TPA: hypothetical protein VE264_06075, partial [Nitrososphaera sp.]|nr:hypothetical protein [Nitrososphaera sp.]
KNSSSPLPLVLDAPPAVPLAAVSPLHLRSSLFNNEPSVSLLVFHMVIITLQQVIDERISFLKEQINPNNKPEVNSAFQIQIDTIRHAVQDLENVEALINQKKEQLKNSKDVHKSERLFAELDGLEWLQRQIARYT